MALSRLAVVQPTDFNIPQLQIPFEQLYAKMQQYQSEKDQGSVLAELMPKYIEQDAESAGKFRELTTNLSDITTKAFESGNTGQAMRTLRNAQNEIKKQWQPGGLANALQSRYDQYGKAVDEIKEGTKGNKSGVYGNYYQNQLKETVGKGIGYDPVTGKYNSIAAPTISKEVILGDEVDTFLKGWMADKGVQITKSADGMWYNKVTQEQVSPDELKSALGQFYQQPHIQQALGIYGWDRAQRMDPNLAREKYRKQIVDQIDGQAQALDGLRSQLKSGNKRQIESLQAELNQQGYGLTVDGKAGPKTEAAVEDYINSIKEEHNKLRAAIPGQLAGIDPMQFAMEDLKSELTNTYVPKYAYTKRDIDMIANQPAIAQMKIRAQNAAMANLKAMLFPPTATMISAVGTTAMTMGTISQQFNQAKDAYKTVESNVLSSLTPEMKKVFASYRGGSTGSQADAYKISNVLFAASQAAMRNGKFNPNAFVRSLEQQNISMTDAEMRKHAMFFQNENNRGVLEGIHDQLQPAAAGMKISEEMFLQYRDQALKSNHVDWSKVAYLGNFGKTSSFGTGGIGPGGSSGTFVPDADAVKEAYKRGDPAAVKALNQYVDKLSVKDQSQIFKGENAINLVLNEKLKPFEDQLMTLAKTNIASIVDYSAMDKTQLAQLGLDSKGKRLLGKDGKPTVRIESANIGTTVINGYSSPVILMKTSAMQAPIALPMTALNAPYVSTLVNNITALGINPNNPSDIVDEGTLNAGAILRYDLDQDAGTAFSPPVIASRLNNPGPVGLSILKTSKGTVELQSFVVKDKGGSGSYLITTSSPSEADELRKNPRVKIQDYQNGKDNKTVPLRGGHQGIIDAIHATKADLYRGEVLQQAYQEPFNVTRQPSNQTANPSVLMNAFNLLGNDF